MTKANMPKRGSKEYRDFRKEIVREVRNSDKTVKQIAEEKGMNNTTLHNWCKEGMGQHAYKRVIKRGYAKRGPQAAKPKAAKTVEHTIAVQVEADFQKDTNAVKVYLNKDGSLRSVSTPGNLKVMVFQEQ